MSLHIPIYFDNHATTPCDPAVVDAMVPYLSELYGNAASRSHAFGWSAREAVENAREQVASLIGATSKEIVFTSGATESDNISILGLLNHGVETNRRHIVSTTIEHKAVLEPLEHLADKGFEVDLVGPEPTGAVNPDHVLAAVRDDTLLVTVMHVNNETGIRQPIEAIGDGLLDPGVFFHSDAAQGFGKELAPLRHQRLDLISVSGHKLYAPKGIGALIVRRRERKRPPLSPLLFGGGQERGLRPGTLPVHLVVGLGLASQLALDEGAERRHRCESTRKQVLEALTAAGGVINGDPTQSLPHIINASIPGLDSEAVILALRDIVSISNGSACTSASYEPSHVLTAMGLNDETRRGAVRLSWGHESTFPDPEHIDSRLNRLH